MKYLVRLWMWFWLFVVPQLVAFLAGAYYDQRAPDGGWCALEALRSLYSPVLRLVAPLVAEDGPGNVLLGFMVLGLCIGIYAVAVAAMVLLVGDFLGRKRNRDRGEDVG
jgi:hypothetical protein